MNIMLLKVGYCLYSGNIIIDGIMIIWLSQQVFCDRYTSISYSYPQIPVENYSNSIGRL